MRREDRSSISTYPLADLGWKLLLDFSLRDVKQDDSNNEVAPSRGGEQIDDILDGLVGAVVGDFESAVWAILRIRTAFGADLRPRTRRIFCQPCLDWSERRYHLKGTRRSSDSGSSIGARMAQMCVGQPCTPTNVVWKGGLVRNLPDRDQQRGCANRSIMRPTTPDSLALQLLSLWTSEFMGNHDLNVMGGADSVD